MFNERWIPKDSTPVTKDGINGIVYTSSFLSMKGEQRYSAMGYRGKSNKPAFNYIFRTLEQMNSYIDEFFKNVQGHQERITQRRTGMICPKCQDDKKVYDFGVCPIEGPFVLCSDHGIVLVKKVEQKTSEKRRDIKMVDIEKYQKKINAALEKSLAEMPSLSGRDVLLYKLAFNVGVHTGVTLFQEDP